MQSIATQRTDYVAILFEDDYGTPIDGWYIEDSDFVYKEDYRFAWIAMIYYYYAEAGSSGNVECTLDFGELNSALSAYGKRVKRLYMKDSSGDVVKTITGTTTFSGANRASYGEAIKYGGHSMGDFYAYTLYVEWDESFVSINYYDQGGASFSGNHGSGYATSHTNGNSTTLDTPTKAGYDFGGWYLNDPTCSSNRVETLSASTTYTTISLYAKWTPQTYNIKYYYVGTTTEFTAADWGSVSYPTKHTYGTATTLKMPATSKKYTFTGWYTNSNGSGTAITSLGAKSYTGAIKLYAKKTPQTYNIKYYYVGTTTEFTAADWGNVSYPTTHTYGTATTLKMPATSKKYTFIGWYTNSNGSGTAIASLGAEEYTDTIKLYGNIKEKKLTLNLMCDNYARQQYMIYIYKGDKLYMQFMPTKSQETIQLEYVEDYAATPYKVCFVFGYFGNITFESLTNGTASGRNVTLTTFADASITYKIATPSINSSIMI